jgi:hypothetical protein
LTAAAPARAGGGPEKSRSARLVFRTNVEVLFTLKDMRLP